jgi:hypothetical protein
MGGADEACRRDVVLGADLPAESVYFFLSERFPRAAGAGGGIAMRIARIDDAVVDGVRAGGVGFSRSTESIVAMGALHLVFWVIALYFGLRFLSRGFAHMDDRTGGGFKVWMVVFVLVMLQMTTALRPIIGTADRLLPEEKKFFLGHWFEVVENSTR